MSTPRLRGAAARAAAVAAGAGPIGAAVRATTMRTYRVAELLALPAHDRGPVPEHAMPLRAAPPRRWRDASLGAPESGGALTSRQLVSAYRAGTARPIEVVEALLARIRAGSFGACTFSPFVAIDEDRARSAARAADARWTAGTPLGPLDGVPVPVKDEHDMVGLVTRGGAAYRDERADADSFLVRRLTEGGAVVFGKSHTTEWGMNPCGLNAHFDMPRNAWASDRAAGGSSTGTGAAVALGLATVGSGSDGGGSIRIPSAIQGVYGIKPSFQRIGRSGNIYGSGTVSAVGPIGASTSDLVDFLAVAASEPDPNDYASTNAPRTDPSTWERALGRGVSGCRIGIPRREWMDAEAPIAQACERALRALQDDGAELVEIDLPLLGWAQTVGVLSIGPETMANLEDDFRRHPDQFSAELTVLMRVLGRISAREYLVAQRTRAALRQQIAAALLDVHVIALPTLPTLPPMYTAAESRVDVIDEIATRDMCRFAFAANLCGLPAGSAPVGRVDGLPVGLQIMGDAWDEASVLAVLAHVERTGIASLGTPPGYLPLVS